ncbi:MAG: DNA translocase FtsK 4TM domain-containing protein [Sulfurospirillaceae bacterium]|nr:DNA translocase FtsK 4TM domain-containing protein [Sulfurospirillaceae bacterium]
MLPDASIVGKYGAYAGGLNKNLFGYVAFIYPFFILIPGFFVYKDQALTQRRAEITLSFLLMVFAILMLQAITAEVEFSGYVGVSIVEMLKTLVGIMGVWIFIASVALLSMSILLEIGFYEMFASTRSSFAIKNSVDEDEDFPTSNNAIKISKVSEKRKQKEEEDIPFDDVDTSVESGEDVEKSTRKKEHKKVEILNEVEENKKILSQIEQGECDKPKDYKLPPLSFLASVPTGKTTHMSESEIDRKIADLLDKLRRFKIDGDIVRTYSGPVVTTFEFRPAPHVKVSRILTLQDDLAMALKAKTIRIQAPIPGKDVVGIEVPNQKIDTIYLKEILESDIFQKSSSPLTIVLGKDIVGNAFVTDLKKLPHLLIAGTTGSGKSVGINAMLLSLLYRNSPDTLRFLMIDPKMLEFSIYNDIPHLLTPVITKPKQAILALSNMVNEMERRYQIMSRSKTKNIEGYNEKAKKIGLEPLPYIVVIIDELADLMMTSGKDVEFYIARLAQMARASGIHLIVATQRPSVDVVTGLIKANLPSRISFKVGQKIDSKVILDAQGADSLLGNGDMLFTPPGTSGLIRLHAPYTSEDEIDKVVEYLKKQRPVKYDESFLKDNEESAFSSGGGESGGDIDELFEDAKAIVQNERKSSISYIQRRLQIGYNRAARIVEQLEAMGIVSAQNSKGQREIL